MFSLEKAGEQLSTHYCKPLRKLFSSGGASDNTQRENRQLQFMYNFSSEKPSLIKLVMFTRHRPPGVYSLSFEFLVKTSTSPFKYYFWPVLVVIGSCFFIPYWGLFLFTHFFLHFIFFVREASAPGRDEKRQADQKNTLETLHNEKYPEQK